VVRVPRTAASLYDVVKAGYRLVPVRSCLWEWGGHGITMADMVKLFVYGTLIPGECNYPAIARYVRTARSGTIEGVLVSLGAYPAFIPGSGRVRGALLEVDEAALAITDKIEDTFPEERDCLYLRKETDVRLHDGTTTRALVYEFAVPEQIISYPRPIAGEEDGVPVYDWCGRSKEQHHRRAR
jgi:gamma-glutamylcyclotransferase (GGCT)/AIG2-like uncharacterized protein YtfP